MAYILNAYAVDLNAVKREVGRGDAKLQAAIIKSHPDEFDDDDDFEPGSNRVLLRDALNHLLAGKAALSGDFSQHAYALEELCRYLAKKEWSTYLLPQQKRTINRFLNGPPVDLPDEAGFPNVGWIGHEELPASACQIEKEWIEQSDGELHEDGAKVLGVLAYAVRKGLDIVLFYG